MNANRFRLAIFILAAIIAGAWFFTHRYTHVRGNLFQDHWTGNVCVINGRCSPIGR